MIRSVQHACIALLAVLTSVIAPPPQCSAASYDVFTTASADIPDDFPHFIIPGKHEEMDALRHLDWHHYSGLSPKATLWDEWLLPPAIWPSTSSDNMAELWRKALSNRIIDPDGYVASHQHGSIAHQHGWPFPFWSQGGQTFGWHFSFENTIGPNWRTSDVARPADWTTTDIKSLGIEKDGWGIIPRAPLACIAPPTIAGDAHESPFVQFRWRADNLSTTATPYLEWTTKANPEFSPDRRFYFDPPDPGQMTYTMLPVFRHPAWQGTITGLRLNLGNQTAGGKIVIQALFSQYDTRHDVNNPSFVSACVDYFQWTHDLNFLRDNIERMREAMRFMESEFGTDTNGIVTVPWVGHEGTSGISRNADGGAKQKYGYGIGNNYWDLLPFGKQDSYATIRHYGASLKMAEIEGEIAANPGWNIPTSPLARSAVHWTDQAKMTKENGNRLFWNEATGRFTLGIDSNGKQADFGYTFLNLEAVYYNFATPDHARRIMDWIDGQRMVTGDTSQGKDIYHWRFAPRASTRRNINHYGWFWSGADSIPFGDQVQDGGAVLGFSFHDIMGRLRTNGPDDAARRLNEITNWYSEVVTEGGYRAYYSGNKHDGTMQGAGTAGGLGLDKEFFESGLLPQVMLEGFLGFKPTPEGFNVDPQLPSDWPSLTIDNITLRNTVFSVTATSQTVTVAPKNGAYIRSISKNSFLLK